MLFPKTSTHRDLSKALSVKLPIKTKHSVKNATSHEHTPQYSPVISTEIGIKMPNVTQIELCGKVEKPDTIILLRPFD
jgi:hypothetical protein